MIHAVISADKTAGTYMQLHTSSVGTSHALVF